MVCRTPTAATAAISRSSGPMPIEDCGRAVRRLLQVGPDDVHQLVGALEADGIRLLAEAEDMAPDVVLDDLGHQTVHGPAGRRDELKDDPAFGLGVERTRDRLDLAADAIDTVQKLRLFAD